MEPGDGGGAGRRGDSGVRQAPLGYIAAGGAAARALCGRRPTAPRCSWLRGRAVGSRGGGEGARGEVRVRVRQGQRRVCQGLLVKFSASRAPARALWAAAGHPVALFGQLCAFGILAHRAGHESRAGRPSSRKVALYAH